MKNTRVALWHSVIALLLCVSMLIGSTFAWFTDTVSSNKNIIKTGNLDLEMYWTDDLEGGQWHNVEEDGHNTIFSYDNWEPGYTEVKYIKLVNAGKLALNYELLITPQGGVGKLAEVINVFVGEDTGAVDSREDLTATDGLGAIGLLDHVLEGGITAKGTLLAAGEQSPFHKSGETVITVAMNMITTAGNDYQNQDAGKFTITALATQAPYEKDSFGADYDAGAEMPEVIVPVAGITVPVTPVDGKVGAGGVTMAGEGVSAIVPEGTLLSEGAKELTLTITPLENTTSDITVVNNEILIPVDVHIEGVSENNTTPIIVNLGSILPKYLNMGNYKLAHVEDGVTNYMEYLTADEEFSAHNQYKYDPLTGETTVAMASFSEVAAVADTDNAWNGEIVTDWYNTTDKIFEIANADELAGFGAIVGGMNGQTKDSFENKTVKLLSDINLGDAENGNVSDKIFYPIGYYNSTGKYERTDGSVTSSVSSFEGTFDGNGHTVSNFYQNTWEMFGDYNSGYSGTPNYYNDAKGLFGYVVNGTVKNLTVSNFSSDGEFTPTGVIAAYAVNSTFENIAITNCNPRVYNTGNGGIVGIGGNTDDPDTYKLTFNNITIDNSNKITALWGSWDVACGGLVGMFRGAGHVYMTNCHVAAQMDVYNDVCGNYQYYWYRYSGMMVGTNKTMVTDEDGYTVPETSKFHAENCTVHFGDWNDYYYCELVANSLASYTHDHQFSRLEEIKSLDEIKSGDTWTKTGNFLLISGDTKTCYHIVKDSDGTLKQHLHTDAGEETVNGKTVLKEDKQIVYLPFNQLFTGYGWGVKHIPVYNGEDYAFEGITILDREVADSVEKFARKEYDFSGVTSGTTIRVGDIFEAINADVAIKGATVIVAVTDLTNTGITADFTASTTGNWEDGIIKFNGTNGQVKITIQDYYFCKPTSITVTVGTYTNPERFAYKFPNVNDYLYRVGNLNEFSISNIFKLADGVDASEIGDVEIAVKDASGNELEVYTAGTGEWNSGTIKFEEGYTGPVKVTIEDDNHSMPLTLNLEVITAKNITKAESATANDVVLLNNISGTFVVSGGHTFYGNGFTVKLPTTSVKNKGNGFTGYISIGAAQDDGIANGGNLDNVRIEGPVYPEMYIYRDQAEITDKNDPDYGDGYNMRYFVNSVIVYGGNCTISNSYISGSRTALCLRGGNNVVIENTTLSGGAYANLEICAGSKVTLRNLTTVQTDVKDSYGKGKTAHGLGIAVSSGVVDIYIEGELNQYNWLNQTQWNGIVPSAYQSTFPKFFTNNEFSKHWHYLNGSKDPYVNLAMIFACNWDTSKIHDGRTTVDYVTTDATIAGVAGGVYSKDNTVGGNVITDINLADPGYTSPGFYPVAPVFNFDNTVNNDADDANDANDTYCVYNESTGTLKIGVSGDSKTLDLSGISVTKDGAALAHTAYLNGTQINGSSVTIKSTDGAKQTLTFKATSNDAGYDVDGNPIPGSIEYTWTVTVEIAVLSYPAPVWNMGGDYQFDTSNCVYAYYATTSGYGEAVPIYEGIKVNYYDKSGKLVNLDLSGTTTLPTGSANSNSNAFTYTLADGSTLTMKFSSGWKSGATTHQFTTYNKKVYIYPQSLDNDNYIRAKTTNQDFDVKITYTFTDPNGQSTGAQTMRWYNAKASNGSVSTVQWKTFDSTNGKTYTPCVTPDTLVTLADGTQKEIQYVTYEDQLLVWDFYKGEYTVMPSSIVMNHGYNYYEIVTVNFSDGTTVKTTNGHGFYDLDLNKFVILRADNVAEHIGHRFAKVDGDGYTEVQLVDYSIKNEYTESWSILTAVHYNCILEGMLTLTPAEVEGSPEYLMPYEIGEDMKYIEDAMQADIDTYGLYTYEDFAEYMSYEQFAGLGLANFKVSVAKGYITWEEILYLISIHIG